jgi:uncharacterized protein YciI
MILIELKHIADSNEIDMHLQEHRRFLQENYNKGLLLVSGPKIPRSGGICIAMTSLEDAKNLMKKDPFFIHNLSAYRFVEFEAVKMHDKVKQIFEN